MNHTKIIPHFSMPKFLFVVLMIGFGIFAYSFSPRNVPLAPNYLPTSGYPIKREVVKSASLSFEPVGGIYGVGNEYATAILLKASHVAVAGIDMKLKYDPSVIEVRDIMTPVEGGAVPLKKIDSKKGLIEFSLLAEANDSLPNDTIASLIWIARVPGEKTSFSFEFTPGETSDSNVAELATGKDALTSVVNANYDIAE